MLRHGPYFTGERQVFAVVQISNLYANICRLAAAVNVRERSCLTFLVHQLAAGRSHCSCTSGQTSLQYPASQQPCLGVENFLLLPAERSGAMCFFPPVDVMTTVPASHEAIPHSYRGGEARHDLRRNCCSLHPPTDARILSRSRLQPPKTSTSAAVHGLPIGLAPQKMDTIASSVDNTSSWDWEPGN